MDPGIIQSNAAQGVVEPCTRTDLLHHGLRSDGEPLTPSVLLLTYRTTNLGDDIQSFAAAQFLPRIDGYINRDRLHEQSADRNCALILHGWFLYGAQFPPPPKISAYVTSFHVANGLGMRGVISSPASRDWLEAHAPIGCRSISTLRLMQELEIPAFFSGCLTLTLPEQMHQRESISVSRMPIRGEFAHYRAIFHRGFGRTPGS